MKEKELKFVLRAIAPTANKSINSLTWKSTTVSHWSDFVLCNALTEKGWRDANNVTSTVPLESSHCTVPFFTIPLGARQLAAVRGLQIDRYKAHDWSRSGCKAALSNSVVRPVKQITAHNYLRGTYVPLTLHAHTYGLYAYLHYIAYGGCVYVCHVHFCIHVRRYVKLLGFRLGLVWIECYTPNYCFQAELPDPHRHCSDIKFAEKTL